MRILITGGAGYIGSVLVPKLLEAGHQITVIDNFLYRQPSLAHVVQNPNLNIVFGDIRNQSLMKELINDNDIIIPLAAIVGAPACDKDPVTAKSVNRDSVLWLINQVGKSQQVIMPTTNSAYGSGDADNFCDESSKLNPLSLYAKDKVVVEQELMNLPNATSFRLATVFGISPRMRLDLLVNNFTYRAITDGFIIIFEGNFKRNYIHLIDVAQAFTLAINNPNEFIGEVFNVGLSTANISKLELCQKIKKLVPNFIFKEEPFGKDPDQRNYVVSNKKIESIGFSPKVSLEMGLQELVSGLRMFNLQPYTNI